ncbi:putative DNA-binding transcriptional regulator AlpA [Paraburkholderia sp. GAS333]
MQEETGPPPRPEISGLSSHVGPRTTESDLRRVFTIDEFCDAYHLSRSFYYRLRRTGQGPSEIHLGRKVMITLGDARAWEERMHTLAHTSAPNQ